MSTITLHTSSLNNSTASFDVHPFQAYQAVYGFPITPQPSRRRAPAFRAKPKQTTNQKRLTQAKKDSDGMWAKVAQDKKRKERKREMTGGRIMKRVFFVGAVVLCAPVAPIVIVVGVVMLTPKYIKDAIKGMQTRQATNERAKVREAQIAHLLEEMNEDKGIQTAPITNTKLHDGKIKVEKYATRAGGMIMSAVVMTKGVMKREEHAPW